MKNLALLLVGASVSILFVFAEKDSHFDMSVMQLPKSSFVNHDPVFPLIKEKNTVVDNVVVSVDSVDLTKIVKYIDTENNVICYYNIYGVSCLVVK